MSDEIRIVSIDELDVEQHAAMQQQVFGDVLKENDIPLERLGADVFAWKLRPPEGPGRAAIVEREGRLVASCSAYPLRLAAGDERPLGWHLCDAATLAEARGAGLFGRIMIALRESMPNDAWTFAFPNDKSLGAFVRADYHAAVEIPLWFRPVIGKGRRAEGITEIDAFGPEHDAFAERIAAQSGLGPLRTAEYLTWRYRNHPWFDYQCFELRRDELEGVLVLNRMDARGRTSLWVMELLASDPRVEKQLAQMARWVAKQQDCDVVLSAASRKLPGAFRVPGCFTPKKHVLMVRSGGTSEPAPPAEWTVQTGDWDTF